MTRLLGALLVSAAVLLPLALPAGAAEIGLELNARALLAGNVRPGAWAAVVVEVVNPGPAVSGELRVRSSQQGRTQYGVEVELPSGAHQQHTVYAQPPVFGSRLHIDLVSAGETLITREVAIKSHDVWSPVIGLVAERPEGIQAGVADVVRNLGRDAGGQAGVVIPLSVADLPERVEAWSAIDRLVWQDVHAATMSSTQIEALRLWIGAGGRLIVVAGTTGVAPLLGFPEDLLPYRPSHTIDIEPGDLSGLLGQLPTDAVAVPALAGPLDQGTVLAWNGSDVVAAQVAWGQGTVTLVGINPAEHWLADSNAGRTLWRRLLPQATGPAVNPLVMPDDSALVGALNN
ncbi:MAG: hypothetical protein M3253_00675, partial [Chloroflexota bacterium]|nr:hypothetical protein [Chloroflexota bacterium]